MMMLTTTSSSSAAATTMPTTTASSTTNTNNVKFSSTVDDYLSLPSSINPKKRKRGHSVQKTMSLHNKTTTPCSSRKSLSRSLLLSNNRNYNLNNSFSRITNKKNTKNKLRISCKNPALIEIQFVYNIDVTRNYTKKKKQYNSLYCMYSDEPYHQMRRNTNATTEMVADEMIPLLLDSNAEIQNSTKRNKYISLWRRWKSNYNHLKTVDADCNKNGDSYWTRIQSFSGSRIERKVSSPRSKIEKNNNPRTNNERMMNLESILVVLLSLNMGLILREDARIFMLIPISPLEGKLILLTQDNKKITSLSSTIINKSTVYSKKNNPKAASKGTLTTPELQTRKNFQCDTNSSSIQWSTFLAEYNKCMQQPQQLENTTQETKHKSITPINLVLNLLPRAIRSLTIEEYKNNNESTTASSQQYKVMKQILNLLIVERNDNNGCNTILLSRNELSQKVKQRDQLVGASANPKVNEGCKIDDDEGKKAKVCINKPTNTNTNESLTTLIQVQVLLRIQLYILICKEKDDEGMMNQFCDLYNNLMMQQTATTVKQSKKSKREKKKMSKKSMDGFELYVSDICSILELVPFIIASNDSLSQYLIQFIFKPFRCLVSFRIVKIIADFFEVSAADPLLLVDNDNDENSVMASLTNKLNDNRGGEITNESSSHWVKIKIDSHKNLASISSSEVDTSSSSTTYGQIQKQGKGEEAEAEAGKNEKELRLFNKSIPLQRKTNAQNPLLMDCRGKYIGSHFSQSLSNVSNLFHQVKIVQKSKERNRLEISKQAQDMNKLSTATGKGTECSSNSDVPFDKSFMLTNQQAVVEAQTPEDSSNCKERPESNSDIILGSPYSASPSRPRRHAASLAAEACLAMRKKIIF